MYETHFEVTQLKGSTPTFKKIKNEIKELIHTELDWDGEDGMGFTTSNYWGDKCWEEVCEKIALKYPDVLWQIEGIGEGVGDWWKERVKGNEREYIFAEMPQFKNPNLRVR